MGVDLQKLVRECSAVPLAAERRRLALVQVVPRAGEAEWVVAAPAQESRACDAALIIATRNGLRYAGAYACAIRPEDKALLTNAYATEEAARRARKPATQVANAGLDERRCEILPQPKSDFAPSN